MTRSDALLDLIQQCPLEPIADNAGLERAIAIVNSLIMRDLDEQEQAYLDVLGFLIEAYEHEHHPMAPVSFPDMLRYLITTREVDVVRLSDATGFGQTEILAFLEGDRKPTPEDVKRLAGYFHVSPAVFFEDES